MLINNIATAFDFLPRKIKKFIVLALDVFLCILTTWLAFSLRFDGLVLLSRAVGLAATASILFALPIFSGFGMYRAIFRFTGWFATFSLVRAISLYFLICVAIFLIIGVEGGRRSVGIIQPILLFLGVGSSRLLAKFLFNQWRHRAVLRNQQGGCSNLWSGLCRTSACIWLK